MLVKHFLHLTAFASVFGLGMAVAQQPSPTENKGYKTIEMTTIDLGPEIGVEGRQLRLRLLTLEPGGVIGVHSHRDRPAVVHMLEGTLTVHSGNEVRDVVPGTTWSEGKNTTHWQENKGAKSAVFIAADVLKP
jgi:quercetin dioxygenase-like cupin family protein